MLGKRCPLLRGGLLLALQSPLLLAHELVLQHLTAACGGVGGRAFPGCFGRAHRLGWVRRMVARYRLDGLRLDTALYVPDDFLAAFQAAAGVYMGTTLASTCSEISRLRASDTSASCLLEM